MSFLVIQVVNHVLQDIQNVGLVFQSLRPHLLDSSPGDNHMYVLVKLTAQGYCKIGLHHMAKVMNARLSSEYMRKKLPKAILFQHQ